MPGSLAGSPTTYLNSLTYNRLSRPVTATSGSGVSTSSWTYGVEKNPGTTAMYGRLWQLRTYATASPATEYQRLEYAYDAVGNVTILADWGPGYKRGHELFSYDARDRLVGARGDPNWPQPDQNVNDYTAAYEYDAIGNLTRKREWRDGVFSNEVSLSYGNAAHVHAASVVNGSTYGYDANGNLTSRPGQTLHYDGENRLVRVRSSSGANLLRVIYDGDGQRIVTVDSSGTKISLDKLYEQNLTTGAETIFVYAGGRLLATKTGGTVSTIHPDHLGGNALTMQGTTVVADPAFYPFGEQRATSYGTPTTDRRFNGESLIGSVGLYPMGARWYDPLIGRWIQPDSIVPNPANPQSLNRYAFVRNNPLRLTDPSGHRDVQGAYGDAQTPNRNLHLPRLSRQQSVRVLPAVSTTVA